MHEWATLILTTVIGIVLWLLPMKYPKLPAWLVDVGLIVCASIIGFCIALLWLPSPSTSVDSEISLQRDGSYSKEIKKLVAENQRLNKPTKPCIVIKKGGDFNLRAGDANSNGNGGNFYMGPGIYHAGDVK